MIEIRGNPTRFSQIPRTNIFAANISLYTKTFGEEKSVIHHLQKIGLNKAITLDKSIVVYFSENDEVFPCKITTNKVGVKQAS